MPTRLLVDHSHVGRMVTGIERLTIELFSGDALAPLHLEPVNGGSTFRMIASQQLGLPGRLAADRRAIIICPGFPPSIPLAMLGGARVVPYVHDCFLITRPQDLNWRARLYMAPAFRYAVAHLPWLIANTETTANELRRFCRPDADISVCRPHIRDVFKLGGLPPRTPPEPGGRFELAALSTVEPRKNLIAAARIVEALRKVHGFDAHLTVIGRVGWGGEAERLADLPGVTLSGYLEEDDVRAVLGRSHALISTSFDEGLGLPLLEAQHAGLPIIAPDAPVFREVLAGSGLHINPAAPADAAAAIVGWVAARGACSRAANAGRSNIARWNALADADKSQLIERLGRMG